MARCVSSLYGEAYIFAGPSQVRNSGEFMSVSAVPVLYSKLLLIRHPKSPKPA